jgi:hypothetical protein
MQPRSGGRRQIERSVSHRRALAVAKIMARLSISPRRNLFLIVLYRVFTRQEIGPLKADLGLRRRRGPLRNAEWLLGGDRAACVSNPMRIPPRRRRTGGRRIPRRRLESMEQSEALESRPNPRPDRRSKNQIRMVAAWQMARIHSRRHRNQVSLDRPIVTQVA